MKNKLTNPIRIENSFRNLVYRRGYVITDQQLDMSDWNDWQLTQVDKYYIYSDKENKPVLIQTDDNWCFLLGYMVDIKFGTDNKVEIAERICSYLGEDETAFFDYIDEMAGRYLIMYKHNGIVKILGDATCMRTIFYSKNHNVIASHTGIIQDLIGSKANPNMRREWREKYTKGVRYYLPGNYTPFEDIYFLTPNLVMEVESRTAKRFYPREELIIDTAENQAKRIIELVDKEIKVLANSGNKLLLSLSGGEDSRTTLALSRNYIDSFQTFTFYRYPKREHISHDTELERDAIMVKDMSENLNIKNHITIPLNLQETSKEFEDFCEVLNTNTFATQNQRAAYFYYNNFKHDKHVRSNIYEVARASYWRDKKLPSKVSPKSLAKCYSVKAEDDPQINKYFAEYYDYAEMDKILNYNPYDLFYWEYRMGTWHAHLLLEADVIHDTQIVINCRKILSHFVGVSYHDKINNNVCKSIIQQQWPVLNAWGVNTLTRPIDTIDSTTYTYGQSLNNMRVDSSSPTNNELSFFAKTMNKQAKFHMVTRSPKMGDSLTATIPLETIPDKKYECILQLRSLFENHKLLGRAEYKVFIGGTHVLTEDLASWREINQIRFNFLATDKEIDLKINIEFLQDCVVWNNWEQRTTMVIDRVVLRDSSEQKPYVYASSPYSKIQSIES
jgi:hypothetical protein